MRCACSGPPAKHLMAGMLTPEQMQELSATRGIEFDKLFLKARIENHLGVSEMAANLSSASAVREQSTVFKFAEEVDTDQTIEIQRMLEILEGIK